MTDNGRDFSSIFYLNTSRKATQIDADETVSNETLSPAERSSGFIPYANYELDASNRIKVNGKPCFITAPWAEPDGVDWSGECKDGKAYNNGEIVWRKSGSIIWKSNVGEASGLVLKDGKLVIQKDLSGFRNETVCIPSKSSRHIDVIAPKGTDPRLFENSWLTYYILERSANLIAEECKRGGELNYQDISVRIFIDGSKEYQPYIPDSSAMASARADSSRELSWKYYRNAAIDALNKVIERENSLEREEKRAADRKQRELIALKQAEQKRRQEEEKRRAAEEAEAERQRQLQALKEQVELQWIGHMEKVFSGQHVIQNVSDLLYHNKPKAISLLSKGVKLELATQHMSFQDGSVSIMDEHEPTDVLKPVRDAARAQLTGWSAWIEQTSSVGRDYTGPGINVVCRLNGSALENLDGKTRAQFDAKLSSLNGRSAIFDCELRR